MVASHMKCVTPTERSQVKVTCDAMETCSSLVDPALRDGMELYFFQECNANVRNSDSDAIGMKCCLNFKLLTAVEEVEMEITSESDLFFNYIHRVTRDEYQGISEKQRLTTPFETYATTLKKMILCCVQNNSFVATLYLKGNEGRLSFIQNAEYKFIDLLECKLQRANEFRIVDNITYRYNVLKERVNHFGQHLEDVNNVLKAKNLESVRQKLFE